MNCFSEHVNLKGQSKDAIIKILLKERNEFAQSRQKWISAAFMLNRNDKSEYERLVSEELCLNCIKHYHGK